MLLWCIFPYYTSVKNGLGSWDGYSNIFFQVATWGLPYFIGRCYFKDWESFRELGIALLIGGLIYIPFCLFEVKMSPQLHKYIYGRRRTRSRRRSDGAGTGRRCSCRAGWRSACG